MSLYVIGIGGTGAKCIESIIHLAALGLFAEDAIKVLFVDADETNGNLDRTRNTLSLYQKCYGLLGGEQTDCGWVKTKLQSFDVWSPFEDQNEKKELKSFFHYSTLKNSHPELGHLFDVLYSKDEQTALLDVGFRGRPAIGAAVMSRVNLDRLDQEPWGTLINSIQGDAGSGKTPRVLFCGSIFGGTGASGIPTLARLLGNKLDKLKVRDRVKIGGILSLPYFGFAPDAGEDPNEVYAKSEQFLLNSEAALRYYGVQARGIFDTAYLLGNQTLSRVKFSVGKNSQRNDPHFVELYAGLAAQHFLQTANTKSDSVVLVSRSQVGRLGWKDLPDANLLKPEFVNAARFAFVWLADICPELGQAKSMGIDRAARSAPWLNRFFNTKPNRQSELPNLDDVIQSEAIVVINEWCDAFLRWVFYLHQCEEESIQLFNTRVLGPVNGQLPEGKKLNLQVDNLPNLVREDERERTRLSQDNMKQIKQDLDRSRTQPPNTGVVGLAKALYIACRL